MSESPRVRSEIGEEEGEECPQCGAAYGTENGLAIHRNRVHGDGDVDPWQDKDTLQRLYHGEGMSMQEVGDQLGVSMSTVRHWMIRHGIPRDTPDQELDGAWKDEDVLRELYYEEGLGMGEIGDRLGCSNVTVANWMDRFGLERRSQSEAQRRYDELADGEWLREKYVEGEMTAPEVAELIGCTKSAVHCALENFDLPKHSQGIKAKSIHPTFDMNRGYMRATAHYYGDEETETRSVRIHRLVAVAEHGFDAVCGMHVHHENGIKWDNRPGNLQIIDAGEHQRIHSTRSNDRWDRDMYHDRR